MIFFAARRVKNLLHNAGFEDGRFCVKIKKNVYLETKARFKPGRILARRVTFDGDSQIGSIADEQMDVEEQPHHATDSETHSNNQSNAIEVPLDGNDIGAGSSSSANDDCEISKGQPMKIDPKRFFRNIENKPLTVKGRRRSTGCSEINRSIASRESLIEFRSNFIFPNQNLEKSSNGTSSCSTWAQESNQYPDQAPISSFEASGETYQTSTNVQMPMETDVQLFESPIAEKPAEMPEPTPAQMQRTTRKRTFLSSTTEFILRSLREDGRDEDIAIAVKLNFDNADTLFGSLSYDDD